MVEYELLFSYRGKRKENLNIKGRETVIEASKLLRYL